MVVDAQLQFEIERFLYHEAEFLDEHRFREWLDLFTEDTHYWMPVRMTVASSQEALEWTNESENSYFDDEKTMLEQRIRQIETGCHWAEEPRSRTRHLVSNVSIAETNQDSELRVQCNFIVYRNRLARDEDWWVGRRQDVLRKVDGQWKIARREIFLDQTTLQSKNISNFL